MKAVSLFSGIGGIELGLHRAGIETVASVEIDVPARGVISDRFDQSIVLHGDVREVNASDFPDWDPGQGILTAGFPCQDVSVAGRRAGLAGARTGLFWEVVRLLDETKAGWVLLENVPGLLSSHDGRDMGAVLGALSDLGYRWAYRVLDARFFGVPQRRRRVFIVGNLGGAWPAPGEVLLEPARSGGDSAPLAAAGQEVAGTLDGGTGNRGWAPDTDRMTFVPALSHAVRAGGSNGPADDPDRRTFVADVVGVRRLTPLECERLMGFPDGWTATSWGQPQFDSARYKQLGNAVAVPVVEWVARRLMAACQQEEAA